MFNKKKIDLTNLENFLETIGKFNESQIETLKTIKELKEKQDKFSTSVTYLTNTIGECLDMDLYLNNIKEGMPNINLNYKDKEYSLVPNCRNKSVINKSEAVKILEVNENGNQETKWTKVENLTEAEKKEFENDGFIIEKIVNKEEKNV